VKKAKNIFYENHKANKKPQEIKEFLSFSGKNILIKNV